jgi:transcriptional regulator with XRE-family HTH domain
MRQSAQQDPKYSYLPDLLRKIRNDAGLTQRALGKELGKPQSWIYNCETSARRIDIVEFIAWSKACGQDPQHAFQKLLTDLEKDPDSLS